VQRWVIERQGIQHIASESSDIARTRWLQGQDKPKAEWLDAIAADQTLSEPVRQRALQFAREWK